MNLKKWTSALTLCAVTLACTAMPAAAANDTAIVGGTTPNLQAAADAMAAAMGQMNGGTSSGSNGSSQPQPPASGDTESVGIDYVTLTSPATTIDGQTYLPLRATFSALKDQAMTVEWKPEGQQKIKLTTTAGTAYEVYLTAAEDGLQLVQGGTTYTLKNVSGSTYVTIDFFQAIVANANISLSGSQILVLTSTNGQSVWSGDFWTGMNSYQLPVVEPEPTPVPEPTPEPTPEPEVPDITYPDVNEPVTPPADNNTSNGGSTGNGGTTGGSSVIIGDNLLWPANSKVINSNYGYRIDPVGGVLGDFHLGLDINGSTGDPVYAAQGGTVIRASWFSTYGNCIDIQHPSGLVTRYAHLSAYHVSVGDTVSQGQVIADIGATGNVTGPHLHFETIVNGSTVDPLSYFN